MSGPGVALCFSMLDFHEYHVIKYSLSIKLVILPDFLTGALCHKPYSQERLPNTFMLNEHYTSTVGNLGAVAIAIPNDDSDSDGEYYSLNQYSAACLVRYLPESFEC